MIRLYFGLEGGREQIVCQVWIAPEHLRVSREILAVRLAPEVGGQNRLVGLSARDHLNPEVAHLVGGVLSPHHGAGWMMRVARIVCRVVVGVAHRHRGPFGQHERRGIAIHVLPAEVPVVDRDQPARRAVRQLRLGLNRPRQIVGVRLDGEDFDVDRQLVAIGDDVLAGVCGDVDRLAAEPQSGRRPRRRIISEEESDGRCQTFRLAGWLKVQLDYEIAARLEPPLRARRRRMRRLPRGPSEQLSFGIAGIALHAAGVARLRITRVELTRRARAVDAEVRMVDDARVAGMKFDSPHRPRQGRGNGEHESAEHVRAVGGHLVGLIHPDDQIRRSELPPVGPVRPRRQRRRVALRSTAGDPLLDQLQLRIAEPPCVLELALPRDRLPWRHHAPGGGVGDLRRMPPDLVVADEAERSDFARPVA